MTKEKISSFLNKLHLPTWLLILLGAIILLRLPSFFEPYSYGDEMIYLTLGQGVRQGIPLYLMLHDNKPPLLYLISSLAGNLFWLKVILATWCLGTTILFWKLTQTLFPQKKRFQKLATIIFAIFSTLPTFEGNIANAELFFIGPVIGAFYLLFAKKESKTNLFFAGILFSLAALFKIPAVIDLFALPAFWLITGGINLLNVKKTVWRLFYLGLGLALPIALTFLWYTLRGAFHEYLVAAFLQNFGYVSSWRTGNSTPFLVKNGPLLLRFGITLLGSSLLSIFRKRLGREFIFLSLWLLFSLFAVTLSERPYPHYFIQAIPSLSCLLAILIASQTRLQTLAIIPISLAIFVPVYFKFWYYPTGSYYLRFTKLILGQTNQEGYLASFDPVVPRNYEIAKTVVNLTNPNDKIFVWGNTATIYALTRRLPPIKYVADYHIKDFSSPQKTIEDLSQNNPALIIVMPNASAFEELKTLISSRYLPVANIKGVVIYKKLSPKVISALQTIF